VRPGQSPTGDLLALQTVQQGGDRRRGETLRDRPSTAEAFAAYEGLRRRRVEAVVARGKRTGDAKAPGPVGRWVRDRLVMPLVAASMNRAGSTRDAWLTGHHIDWDSPVPA
jgi:hypothetical protein